MAPVSLPRLSLRNVSSSNPPSTDRAGYIIGFAIAGLLLSAIAFWITLRVYRRRVLAKRSVQLDGVFHSVSSLVEVEKAKENHVSQNQTPYTSAPIFSRANLTPSVVFPEKVVTRTPRSPVPPISDFKEKSADSACSSQSSSITIPPQTRHHSRRSSGFSAYFDDCISSPPGLHDPPPQQHFQSTTSQMHYVTVRQLFEPRLPDELSLTRLGDHLIILQSFDDGWCIVSRATGRNSLMSPASGTPDAVELGLVPAWVFSKPINCRGVDRPVRSTSTNALHAYEPGSRKTVISWSNYA
ncbi:hypothetical protein BV22DRAFT_1044751 [Leucogyrophana mollusca]|uniref:Uncharacterized protein n=1 Tax=Leucogyrophana mollusca TaxID=85980 RepID=A0ACB8BS30_9AGAM|nr:hypothetical protein BV22DRAFT_1044751 [Leucogyrophana mollusca]